MEGTETGRRIRAARAFGGFSNRLALAERLQISKETLQRIETGQRPAKRPELLAISEACEVPMWFLEGGWDGWRTQEDAGATKEPPPLRGRDLRHLGSSTDQAESA